MGKYKPARGKPKASATPKAGLPCVVLLLSGIVMMMVFFFFVMRDANR
jgi:hypothetical protein